MNNNFQLKIPGAITENKSIDTVIVDSQAVNYPIEFLNSLEPRGIHRINCENFMCFGVDKLHAFIILAYRS